MWILIVAIVVIGTIAAGASLLWDKDAPIKVAPDCSSCSPSSLKCEQECMMEAAVNEIEYFDDEELDAFKGRDSNGYSDQEADLFREVMETVRPDELRAWCHSLTLRGVSMPDQVKDEYVLLIGS